MVVSQYRWGWYRDIGGGGMEWHRDIAISVGVVWNGIAISVGVVWGGIAISRYRWGWYGVASRYRDIGGGGIAISVCCDVGGV